MTRTVRFGSPKVQDEHGELPARWVSKQQAELMSKAFTREDAGTPEEEDDDVALPALPAGAKNYITPAGWQRMQDELKQLRRVERPKVVEVVSWAAGNGDRSENGDYLYGKKRLREIDRRIRFLGKRLEIAEVVDPDKQTRHDRVFFGATVTYVATSTDKEHTVTIVGADEADTERNRISWLSPVARALLKAEVGDEVAVQTPGGRETLEVLRIRYDKID
ncbi:transcription elongation factor GreB [Rhodospirillales bacterium TMPK1]|uniref:Transcription elongation factor GreB n=2 Tax=Roseiterribacter gracilis TaxID=2812848 RepID=A0A8S8XA52_9PROT|nr:transcription elongation factor GreB [Rhodospirillales bacterium TMPK1]